MSVLGVVQVRMGSSRIPGKAMIDFAGKPLIWHIVDRMRRVSGVARVILATSTAPENSVLMKFAQDNDIGFYAHDGEDDLAGRIAGAIADFDEPYVLKTGGDCPLIDPSVMQRMVDISMTVTDVDFVSNRVQWSYPLGLSADLISRRAINWANMHLTSDHDREFFALYIRDHPEQFKVVPVVNDIDLSHHGWTVDEKADIKFVKSIFNKLYKENDVFGLTEILAFVENKDF